MRPSRATQGDDVFVGTGRPAVHSADGVGWSVRIDSLTREGVSSARTHGFLP